MAELREFRLPDVGEGLTEGEVLSWYVAVGDTVVVNQVVVEVETAKAAVELPIPWAGVVTALHVEPGVTIPVGTALLTVDVAVPTDRRRDAAPDEAPDEASDSADPEVLAPAPSAATETMGARPEADLVPSGPPPQARREAVLVGYGVREAAVTRRPRRRPPARAGSRRGRPRAATGVPRTGQATGAQAGQGPRRGPGEPHADRTRRDDHSR